SHDSFDAAEPDHAGPSAARRVLHVIDAQWPGGGPCTFRLLADVIGGLGSIDHEVAMFGSANDASQARRCGVKPARAICTPRLLPFAGCGPLRRFIASAGARRGEFDLVHAWNIRCAALAAAAAPRTPRLATLHAGFANSLTAKALPRFLQRSHMHILTS